MAIQQYSSGRRVVLHNPETKTYLTYWSNMSPTFSPFFGKYGSIENIETVLSSQIIGGQPTTAQIDPTIFEDMVNNYSPKSSRQIKERLVELLKNTRPI